VHNSWVKTVHGPSSRYLPQLGNACFLGYSRCCGFKSFVNFVGRVYLAVMYEGPVVSIAMEIVGVTLVKYLGC